MESIAYITSRKKQYDLKDIEARRTKLDKKDLPKNISSFLNDEGYIDKTVDDLLNYYTKSETYSKEEVQELISTRILIKIVDKLPESNISTSTIYFLKRPEEDLPQSQYQSDVYDEYIYVDATWELIGNTYVDLTPYYTKEEVEIVIDNKILEERLIRENAEFTLQNNIDALEQKTDSEITQIKQINLNQDNSISTLETNLQNEITRATNKENELSDRSDNFDLHIENNENPHNVTKTQIGLSDVENLPIDDAPTLNSENYIKSGGVFNALENKVDKIEGKGLSDENFTYAEKTKLSNLENYDDTEIANNVNLNTSAISILNSDSTVDGSVDNKIKNAILDVSGLQFNVVEELPITGENRIIYFVLNTSINEGKNYYDEYIWINNKFELLGQTVTEIDLSNYHTKAEISALLSTKVSINDGLISTKETWSSSKIAKHSLPLIYDSGFSENQAVEYYKLHNVNIGNVDLLLSTRFGDEVEVSIGTTSHEQYIQAKRNFYITDKVKDIYVDDSNLYVTMNMYFDYLRIYHKSGVLRNDFSVSSVTSIPSTATKITITEYATKEDLKASSNTDIRYVILTGDGTFKSMGDTYCKYQVKNGICYFQFFVATAVDTNDVFTEIYNGLPKPIFSQYFSYPVYYNQQGINKTLQVNISEDGLLMGANTLSNASYMIVGSYPIA